MKGMLFSLVTGNIPGLVLKLVLEALKAMLMRIDWAVVVERFASRVVVWGLHKIESLTTNSVVKGTASDFLEQLSHPDKGLPMVGVEMAAIKAKATKAERKAAKRQERKR